METVTDFIFLGSQITADGDCSHEIKRSLFLGRKAMTNLDSILKSRDITLPTKVHLVKTMAYAVVMYGCESWTIKKAECQRTDTFELWCLEKILESPLDFKEIKPVHPKGNQSWIFIGRTDVEAETPILWPGCEELIHWKRPWCWDRLKAGGERDNRTWDGWMASPTQWTWVWVNSRSWWWTGRPSVLQSMGSQRVKHDWATQLNWTEGNGTRCALNAITDILIRERKRKKRRRQCEDGGRDWSNATTAQGLPATTRSQKKQGTDSPLEPPEKV